MIVCLRPGDIALVLPPGPEDADVWPGVVEEALYLGEVVEYRVRVGERTLTVRASAEAEVLTAGAAVGLRVDPARALVFPAEAGEEGE